jgi:hypothetical protein
MVSQHQGIQGLDWPACLGGHIHDCPDMGLIFDDMDVPDSLAGINYSADNPLSARNSTISREIQPPSETDQTKIFKPGSLGRDPDRGMLQVGQKPIGALIIIERNDWVDEWVTGGIPIETQPTPEIITSVFQKESPLHDGAMIIRKGTIVAATCYLPLSSAEGLPSEYGTRHRAALGVAERCDAWAIVVSEERGKVSLVREGLIGSIEDPADLIDSLAELMTPKERRNQRAWDRIYSFFIHQWRLKLIILGLVTVGWLFLAGQQNFVVSFKVPVQMENLPAKMEILEPIKPEITVTARGLRKDASTLNARNVQAKIDLTLASYGVRTFRISRDKISLPSKNVDIIKIEPDELLFVIREKQRSTSAP